MRKPVKFTEHAVRVKVDYEVDPDKVARFVLTAPRVRESKTKFKVVVPHGRMRLAVTCREEPARIIVVTLNPAR